MLMLLRSRFRSISKPIIKQNRLDARENLPSIEATLGSV
jgi:hypothetical protein